MKKALILILVGLLVFTACGGKDEPKTETKEETKEEVKEAPKSSLAFEGQEEIGEGKLYLINASGTTEDGNVLWIKKDDYQILQIGIESEDMDGSKPTVIYVDGKEHSTEQFGTSQNSLELKKEHLGEGEHTVEAVQKDGDKIVFYRLMKYKVE